MKFYELDLRQIIPYGIPLNTDSHVEYTSHINDFFLQGFENCFGQLFKVEDGKLTIDYSRSCSAPSSLFACEFCSDSQLEDAITHAGFKYYTTNDHAVNAKFVYDLNSVPFGTEGWLTSVAQYVANSRDIIAKPVYEGKDPYHYGIYLSGDIASSANTSTILSRMIENLGVVGTAHTQVDEFSIEDTSSQLETSAAVGAIDVGIFCEVEIPVVAASKKYTRFMNDIDDVYWYEKQPYEVYMWDEKVSHDKWVRAKFDRSRVYPTSIIIYSATGETDGKARPVAFSEDSNGLLVVTPTKTIYGAYFVL